MPDEPGDKLAAETQAWAHYLIANADNPEHVLRAAYQLLDTVNTYTRKKQP